MNMLTPSLVDIRGLNIKPCQIISQWMQPLETVWFKTKQQPDAQIRADWWLKGMNEHVGVFTFQASFGSAN